IRCCNATMLNRPYSWIRKTLIYRQTRNMRTVQQLLGLTKIESTVRCLGVEVDEALIIAGQVNI
ncbi:MAG: hypothetical protein P8M79_10955, partial [Alphaproteobacteria bacterium]|nr:hypothetical protein [Alphaproteobacteria bacterium]